MSESLVVDSFVGPSNTLAALTAAADQTINMYEELVDPGTGKGKTWLRNAPGLEVFCSISGTGPTDVWQQDGRMWAIADTDFVEVFVNGTFTSFGAVATNPDHVPTFSSNGTAGHQLFITSGLNGYIFDTIADTLTLIADPDFPNGDAIAGEFMDGYFFVLQGNSRTFQISALEDGTSWDALDVGERSEGSDNLTSIRRSHREIWLLGTKTGEIWFDNGDPDFPFAPVQGVFIEQGCARNAILQRIANSVMWATLDQDGTGVANVADGYTPTRVSTFAIETLVQAVGGVPAGARAFTYQEDGHWFYVPHIEDRNDTMPVFDLTMGRWDERGLWDEANQEWNPPRVISHCYIFGKHLVGDRLTGTIYEQSVGFLDQPFSPLVFRRLRRFALPYVENKEIFISRLEVVAAVGLGGLGPITEAEIFIRISRDGGNTFGPYRRMALGLPDDFTKRCYITRVAYGRNLVGELVSDEAVFPAFVQCVVQLSKGTS